MPDSEMPEKRNLVVFFHMPCVDGAASGWCFIEKYKEDPNVSVEIIPLKHGDPEARDAAIFGAVSTDTEVVFADITAQNAELEKLLSPRDPESSEKTPWVKSVTIWDHHGSEKKRLAAFKVPETEGFTPPTFEYEINTEVPSAAPMIWSKLFPNDPIPEIIDWVGKMDPETDLSGNRDYAVAAYIDSHKIDSRASIISTFNKLSAMQIDDMVHEGNAIQADQFHNISKMQKTVLYTHIELLEGRGKMWIPIVNINVQNFGRRVHDALVNEGHQGTTSGVSLAWFVDGDGGVKLSVRTDGHPDAGKIAQYLGKTIGNGGGGHTDAAGVQFKDLAQFSAGIPLYSKQAMHNAIWTPTVADNSLS